MKIIASADLKPSVNIIIMTVGLGKMLCSIIRTSTHLNSLYVQALSFDNKSLSLGLVRYHNMKLT